ncbi:MAG: hypothetical protein R3B38_01620 [Patescibacteria group bacterium]
MAKTNLLNTITSFCQVHNQELLGLLVMESDRCLLLEEEGWRWLMGQLPFTNQVTLLDHQPGGYGKGEVWKWDDDAKWVLFKIWTSDYILETDINYKAKYDDIPSEGDTKSYGFIVSHRHPTAERPPTIELKA